MNYKIGTLIMLFTMLGSFDNIKGQEVDSGNDDGWIPLFNGKNLDNWKVGENAATFSVENGTIKVSGPKAYFMQAR